MISVITPTYNRGYIIDNLFNSLKSQTSYDFEWIVIDDGSTDDTYDKLKSMSGENVEFPITIIRQQNKGKHCAVNVGVAKAKGEFVFIVDSDDMLTPDAIETVSVWIKDVEGMEHIAAVSGLKGHINSPDAIGGFPKLADGRHYIDAKNTDRTSSFLQGDMAEVYKTEILRRYPFKEFEGEKFLLECTVWDKIANDGYYIRWHDKIIYRCEYLEDGLTHKVERLFVENFKGFTYYIQIRIKSYPLTDQMRAWGLYCDIARRKGLSFKAAGKSLGVSPVLLALNFYAYKTGKVLKKLLHG